MIKRILLSVVIAIITTVSAGAQEKMTIAVLELQPKGTSKLVAGVVSDIIRSEMIKTGLYVVIERSQMTEILKEQSFQMSGCVEQSCAVQIGKLLSARKVLMGELGVVGKSYMITVRIVDVEKGSSEFAANEKAETEDTLDAAAANITKKLSQNIVEGNPDYFVGRITRAGYYTRAIIPGLGQFYADRDTKGYYFLGIFAASAGFTVYSYLKYKSAEKAYNDVPRGSPQSEFDSKLNDKEKSGYRFLGGAIFTGAVYIVNWVDILFFSKPEFDSKIVYNIDKSPVTISFSCSPVIYDASSVFWLCAETHF